MRSGSKGVRCFIIANIARKSLFQPFSASAAGGRGWRGLNGGLRRYSKQGSYRSGKGSYFEGGIREPMLVRWPAKVAAGSTCDVPVIGIDFYPTFLEAAGAKVPEGKILDGVSLIPLLTGSGDEHRALFWHFAVYLEPVPASKIKTQQRLGALKK